MVLSEIQLSNFRNHTDSKLTFSPKINLISGDNGQGKTSLIEAISYCCLTKSIFTNHDYEPLQFNKTWFSIFSTLTSDIGFTYKNQIRYNYEKKEKNFLINNLNISNMSSAVGRFPVVFLYPELSSITMGGPAERRKFLDILLSQSSKSYLEDLLDYKRIIKQRNAILSNPETKFNKELIEPWNELLIKRGSKIIHHRINFVNDFKPHLTKNYSEISGFKEEIDMEYKTQFELSKNTSISEIETSLNKELIKEKFKEAQRGVSLVGPHRDDLVFKLNGHPVIQFASQGQHKTILITLKFAEYSFLQEACHETPIVLLDDIFSELDNLRTERLLVKLLTLGQTFITTTISTESKTFEKFGSAIEKFIIKEGSSFLATSVYKE
ncbi:MAG: DNA replication/repair protein RecF [Bacteroidetes bacterium]|nr:DNA replication/repair protein RecF [Bacteroidota bacterium]